MSQLRQHTNRFTYLGDKCDKKDSDLLRRLDILCNLFVQDLHFYWVHYHKQKFEGDNGLFLIGPKNDSLFVQIFLRFLLAKSTRIIHHNQLLLTKFGTNLRLINR